MSHRDRAIGEGDAVSRQESAPAAGWEGIARLAATAREWDEAGGDEAAQEAGFAGPWDVARAGDLWCVVPWCGTGAVAAVAVMARPEPALLVAGLLPALGRAPLVRVEPADEGVAVLRTAGGERLGTLRGPHDLAAALHLLDWHRRAPSSLACLLAACPEAAVERAVTLAAAWVGAAAAGRGERVAGTGTLAGAARRLVEKVDRLDDEVGADGEAELAPPWRIVKARRGWSVVADGQGPGAWTARLASYPTAALVASALAAIGRDPLVVARPIAGEPAWRYELATAAGEDFGEVRLRASLAPPLAMLEVVRRSPESLGRLLAACGPAALERAWRLVGSMRRKVRGAG